MSNEEEFTPTPPPNDLGAEQCVLGAMLLSRDVVHEVCDVLTAESFYRPNHGTIFDTIVDLDAKGEPVDAYTVAASLSTAGILAKVGGAGYLHTLMSSVPAAANGAYYARIVADRALSRSVLAEARRMMQLAQSGTSPMEVLEQTQQRLADLEATTASSSGGPRPWADIIPGVLEEIEQSGQTDTVPGVPTGWTDLDRLLNGLHPGQLVVIAARPGVGKSVALANIAQHASWKHGLPALLFSLEMTANELGKRLISAGSRVPLNVLQSGKLTDDDWVKVANTAGDSAEAPLLVDDTADLTVGEIRARARKAHRQNGALAMIGVDYLQLITPGRGDSRQVQVANISRGLKLLAKQLGVPVVVCAQLNRGPEMRADKRPVMADLRESGAIEADADVVLLLHREDYRDKESPRAGEADFIVDKNRGGPTDTITVAAQLHLSKFVDMAVV